MALDSQLTDWNRGPDQARNTDRVGGVTLSGALGEGKTASSLEEELEDAYPSLPSEDEPEDQPCVSLAAVQTAPDMTLQQGRWFN